MRLFFAGIVLLTSWSFLSAQTSSLPFCADLQRRRGSRHRLQGSAKASAFVTREGVAVVQSCFGRRSRWAEDSAGRPSNSRRALHTRFAKSQQPLLQGLPHLVSERARHRSRQEVRRQSRRRHYAAWTSERVCMGGEGPHFA